MTKDCYNCNNFNESHDIFVSCDRLDDDIFMKYMEITYNNYQEYKDEDVGCEKWESNSSDKSLR